MEWPKVYRVNFAYTFEELEKIMDSANREDQYGCGRYRVSSDWLQIYDRPRQQNHQVIGELYLSASRTRDSIRQAARRPATQRCPERPNPQSHSGQYHTPSCSRQSDPGGGYSAHSVWKDRRTGGSQRYSRAACQEYRCSRKPTGAGTFPEPAGTGHPLAQAGTSVCLR